MRYVLLATLIGCASDNEIHRQDHVDVFLQAPAAEVDILWVVDDSQSMGNEQSQVADAFSGFIRSIDELDIDFHLGVVTTDMDAANPDAARLLGEPSVLTPDDNYVRLFQDRVRVGVDGSDKERGLEAARIALGREAQWGPNQGFLRDEAALALIFVSDENDCSDGGRFPASAPGSACYEQNEDLVPVADFVQGFRELKPEGARVIASGILGPSAAEGCSESWPGHRYRALIEGYGGAWGDICEASYDEIMAQLGESITGQILDFQLSYAPVIDSLLVEVDGALIDESEATGWSYDPDYWMVRFSGSFAPPEGSEILIAYDIAAAGEAPEL